MTATTWSESFVTLDTNIWKNQWGVFPTVLGGGKIKFQKVAGDTCQMSRVPFGAEGSLAARSVAMAFTVYPGESSEMWNLASGNQQGTWPYFEPHANTRGFSFIDGTQRMYAGSMSGYHMYGDIQAPSSPYEIRVSAYLDPGSSLIYNSMAVDGVLVVEDYVQSASIAWDSILGYQLPYFNLNVSGNTTHVVIGGLFGIYGGTRTENLTFVRAGNPSSSTITPISSLDNSMLSLGGVNNLPILYSRNPSDIPNNFFPYGTTVESLAAKIYTIPFSVVDGDIIYAATVAGNGMNASHNGGFRVGTPVAIPVSIPIIRSLTIPVVKTWTR